MSSGVKVLLVLLATCSITLQNPLFIKRMNKRLNNLTANGPLYSSSIRRAVYFHEQSVAIVDINDKNVMLYCDIIEVYEPKEVREVLVNLSLTSRPIEISFSQMTSLMYRCEVLDRIQTSIKRKESLPKGIFDASMFKTDALSLFFGILPGTKWCGIGDIADNYHDLGSDAEIDRCCRTHDLCPVKIRAYRSRYNLTNNSFYSKSHCVCDNALYHCLKNVNTSRASILGNFYFNIAQVDCIEDITDSINSISSTSSRRKFATTRLSF